jgi:hypothetical protein
MYIYNADTYCDSCGEKISANLIASGQAPANPRDEYSYDSDEFPKGDYPSESTDGPSHCGSAGECLEGIDLGEYGLADNAPMYGAETRTVGALLSDELTEHGVSYLQEMLNEPTRTPYQNALHNFWRESFADYLNERG